MYFTNQQITKENLKQFTRHEKVENALSQPWPFAIL